MDSVWGCSANPSPSPGQHKNDRQQQTIYLPNFVRPNHPTSPVAPPRKTSQVPQLTFWLHSNDGTTAHMQYYITDDTGYTGSTHELSTTTFDFHKQLEACPVGNEMQITGFDRN